jgi:hypothetical protein
LPGRRRVYFVNQGWAGRLLLQRTPSDRFRLLCIVYACPFWGILSDCSGFFRPESRPSRKKFVMSC